MPEWISKVFAEIARMPPDVREAAQTALVTTCVLYCVYYIAVALVVWALGRRLIQASFAAWREVRRETGTG